MDDTYSTNASWGLAKIAIPYGSILLRDSFFIFSPVGEEFCFERDENSEGIMSLSVHISGKTSNIYFRKLQIHHGSKMVRVRYNAKTRDILRKPAPSVTIWISVTIRRTSHAYLHASRSISHHALTLVCTSVHSTSANISGHSSWKRGLKRVFCGTT